MTPQEAIDHILEEFVDRFGCNAEGCTDSDETHLAIYTLTAALKLKPVDCPALYCPLKDHPHA